jgi:hypothetical protein
LVKINTKTRLRIVDDNYVFTKQCQQVYYTYTFSFKNDRSRVDWLSIVKTKPKGHVQVVQEDNDELNAIDYVFQIDELVDAYQVFMSINL